MKPLRDPDQELTLEERADRLAEQIRGFGGWTAAGGFADLPSVAKLIGVHPRTLERWIQVGTWPQYIGLARRVFDLREVVLALDARRGTNHGGSSGDRE